MNHAHDVLGELFNGRSWIWAVLAILVVLAYAYRKVFRR